MVAKKLKKITSEKGVVKYEPCIYEKDFKNGEIISMNYDELPKDSLAAKKVSFEDLMFAFEHTKPTINFWEVNRMYSFESKSPTKTILDLELDQIAENNAKNHTNKSMKKTNCILNLFVCNNQKGQIGEILHV